MPKCLDQKTTYKVRDEKDNLLKYPIFETELVMRDEGEIRVYSLRTFTTKSHPKMDINEDESVREHYVTTLVDKNIDNFGHPSREDYEPYGNKREITVEEELEAIKGHITLVNNLRTYGSWQVSLWLSDRL